MHILYFEIGKIIQFFIYLLYQNYDNITMMYEALVLLFYNWEKILRRDDI